MVLNEKDIRASEVQDKLLNNQEGEKELQTDAKVDAEDENEGVPTDSGFALVIAISVFSILTMAIGFNRSLSVLFVDISEEFHEKATIVSLMFTLHALSSSVSSHINTILDGLPQLIPVGFGKAILIIVCLALCILVSNIIMSKTTVRTISVVASVVNTLVSIAISQAPNIVVFLLLFVIKGAFFGALLVSPMSLIGFYFKKRRTFASAFTTAGMCVGFIVFPPITEALRMQYGMRGSFLVLGAIELHVLAFSLLLRPVESYKIIYKRNKQKKELEEEKMLQLSPIYKGSDPTITNGIEDQLPKIDDNIDDKVKENEKLLREVDTSSEVSNDLHRRRSQSDASNITAKMADLSSIDVRHTPGSSPVQLSDLEDLENSLSQSREDFVRCRHARNKSINFERQASHLSAMSMTELPYILPALVEDEEEEEGGKSKKKSFFFRMLNTFIDMSLFKIWRFCMMAVFIAFSVFANYTIIYMPVICSTLEISKRDAALLMTLSGVMDLVTRILTGCIGDFKFVSKPKLVAFSTFVVGTVCHCTRFFTTHDLFVGYAVLVGVFGGMRQNFFNVMLMDYVGVQKMAKAYGLASMIATLTLSVNHPIVAALFDATKGFVVPLHYVGSMTYFGTLILVCEPLFLKLDEKNMAKTTDDPKQPVK